MSLGENVKMVSVQDWDKLIKNTYGRPYSFQQQKGCKSRGIFKISIPSKYTEDDEMHDSVPEEVNGSIMGVKFEKWLECDPEQQIPESTDNDYMLRLFWHRNFYPDIYTVANDLYKKGLLETGKYIIDIDW